MKQRLRSLLSLELKPRLGADLPYKLKSHYWSYQRAGGSFKSLVEEQLAEDVKDAN